jgi:Tol biopolymer transport system component
MWLCFLVAAALAGEVRFAPGDGDAYVPVWSADGKWLAFEVLRLAEDGTTIDLYVAPVAQNGITKEGVQVMLPGGGYAFGGRPPIAMNTTWHPQGLTLFEGSNQGGLYRLYIYSPGGASATELLDTTRAPSNLTFPHISPDGNQVAYVSDRTGNGDIYTWNRSTNAFSRITATPQTEAFPTFSRDGRSVAFTRVVDDGEDVFVYEGKKKGERVLAAGAGDQTRPIWVDDQEILFFSTERHADQWDLVHQDATGLRMTIAFDIVLPLRTRPALSKDREWVAVVYAHPDLRDRVYLSRVDGTKSVVVSTTARQVAEAALAEQNGRVLLAYTGVSDEGGTRRLYVEDVTNALGGVPTDPPGPPEEPAPVLPQREAVSEGPDPWEVGLRYLKRVASAAIVGSAIALTLFFRSRRRSR